MLYVISMQCYKLLSLTIRCGFLYGTAGSQESLPDGSTSQALREAAPATLERHCALVL
jgi:hypothetical protein